MHLVIFHMCGLNLILRIVGNFCVSASLYVFALQKERNTESLSLRDQAAMPLWRKKGSLTQICGLFFLFFFFDSSVLLM